MATLAERLEQLIPKGENAAAKCTWMPTLVAVPLPDDPQGAFSLKIPANTPRSFRWCPLNRVPAFRFQADGTVRVSDAEAFDLCEGEPHQDWFVKIVVPQDGNQRTTRYCLLVWTKNPDLHRPNWKRWIRFANAVNAVLRSEPDSGVLGIRWPVEAVLTFVFRAVVGTRHAEPRDGYQEIPDLWGATLYALSSQGLSGVRQSVGMVEACSSTEAESSESGDSELEQWCKTLTPQGQAILRYLWPRMGKVVSFSELLNVPDAFRGSPMHPEDQHELIKAARKRINKGNPGFFDIALSKKHGGTIRLSRAEAP